MPVPNDKQIKQMWGKKAKKTQREREKKSSKARPKIM
jgi:hypothetical protein